MRKGKTDHTVEGILYYLIQYFEKHSDCFSISSWEKLWLSEKNAQTEQGNPRRVIVSSNGHPTEQHLLQFVDYQNGSTL